MALGGHRGQGQGWEGPLTSTALLSPGSIWKKSTWGNGGKAPKSRASPPLAHRLERSSPEVTLASKSSWTGIGAGEGKATMPVLTCRHVHPLRVAHRRDPGLLVQGFNRAPSSKQPPLLHSPVHIPAGTLPSGLATFWGETPPWSLGQPCPMGKPTPKPRYPLCWGGPCPSHPPLTRQHQEQQDSA